MYLKGRFPWQRAESNVTQEQYLELLQNLIEHGSFTGGIGSSIDVPSRYNESEADGSGESNESIELDGDNTTTNFTEE